MDAMAAARLYLRICEKDYLSESGPASIDDDESSFPTFMDTMSDAGDLVEEKPAS